MSDAGFGVSKIRRPPGRSRRVRQLDEREQRVELQVLDDLDGDDGAERSRAGVGEEGDGVAVAGVDAGGLRLGDHAGVEVDADALDAALGERGQHLAPAAADVEHRRRRRRAGRSSASAVRSSTSVGVARGSAARSRRSRTSPAAPTRRRRIGDVRSSSDRTRLSRTSRRARSSASRAGAAPSPAAGATAMPKSSRAARRPWSSALNSSWLVARPSASAGGVGRSHADAQRLHPGVEVVQAGVELGASATR